MNKDEHRYTIFVVYELFIVSFSAMAIYFLGPTTLPVAWLVLGVFTLGSCTARLIDAHKKSKDTLTQPTKKVDDEEEKWRKLLTMREVR